MKRTSTIKIGGLYIGEILIGVAFFGAVTAAMMLAVNMVYPAWL